MGYIYVIYTREFLKHQEPVYKVGKTENIVARLKQYPRGSKLLFVQYVHDCHLLESHVLNHLTSTFKVRTDIGAEYFEGDIMKLLAEVHTIVCKHACPFTITYDEDANRLKKKSKPQTKNTCKGIHKKQACDDEEVDEEDDDY